MSQSFGQVADGHFRVLPGEDDFGEWRKTLTGFYLWLGTRLGQRGGGFENSAGYRKWETRCTTALGWMRA